jgi:hypothetical protein
MTTLRAKWSGSQRIAEIYDDDGNFIAAVYPTRNGLNAIHIASGGFADEPICTSSGELGLPGYLIKFKQRRP